MRLKINEAIALGNILLKIECENTGKKFVKLTQSNLGRIVYGGRGQYPIVRMSGLCKGTAFIRPEWVGIICEYTGIDANFLFDQPSEFDILYDKHFK